MNLCILSEKLSENQAALIISPENRRYFTGFDSSDGYLVVSRQGSTFFTDSRYIEAAEDAITEADVVLLDRIYGQLEAVIKKYGCNEVLVETSRITLGEFAVLRKNMPEFSYSGTRLLDTFISEIREVKNEEEIVKLGKAQDIAEKAYLKLLEIIKPGISERDVANELEYLMRKFGADGISFDTIAASGENSSKPHAVPGDRVLQNGDFLTIDFGAVFDGYHSDTTRTVAIGEPSEEMKKVYNIVKKAQQAGVDAIRAGLGVVEYDRVARDIIAAEGYGDAFGHSLGHGVGVEIHEVPFCGPRGKGELKAGNVISCEPGIYLPGRFGVRIEDMLLVTETGSVNFCHLSRDLIVL